MNNYLINLFLKNKYERDGNFTKLSEPISQVVKSLAKESNVGVYDIYAILLGYESHEDKKKQESIMAEEFKSLLYNKSELQITAVISVLFKEIFKMQIDMSGMNRVQLVGYLYSDDFTKLIEDSELIAECSNSKFGYIKGKIVHNIEDKEVLMDYIRAGAYRSIYPNANIKMIEIRKLNGYEAESISFTVTLDDDKNSRVFERLALASGVTVMQAAINNGFSFCDFCDRDLEEDVYIDNGKTMFIVSSKAYSKECIIEVGTPIGKLLIGKDKLRQVEFAEATVKFRSGKKDIWAVLQSVAYINKKQLIPILMGGECVYTNPNFPNSIRFAIKN